MLLFRQLAWFFQANWRTYAVALLMLAGVALLNAALPYLIGQTIDRLLAEGALNPAVEYYLLILLGMGALIYLLRVGWRLILFGTSYQLGGILRQRFYQRLTRLGPAFYSQQSTGDLMAKATNDIDAIELAAGEGVLSGFDGALTFVLVIAMMLFAIDWRLTVIALLPFPVMGYGFFKISRSVHKHFQESLERFSDLNNQTQQALSGIRLIKAMGREHHESKAFNKIAEKAARCNYQVARYEALYEPVIYLCLTTSLLLILGVGGWLVWQEQLTVGKLASFTLYMGQLIWPMWAFGWLLNIIERGSAASKRVDALLDTPDTITDLGTHTPQQPDLKVRTLSFAYDEKDGQVLKGVHFDLIHGRKLGITGPTGAGKTTLIQLLMRHWESESGQIQIDDHPLQALSLHHIRACFAYVPQDSFLFSLSIADNISLAQPDASLEQIQHAAKVAALDEDIRHFPDGYNTQVGERGITLSGGQRQRLAIARALITDAPILILDDALSAVDVHTEQLILRHLRDDIQQRSVIIISHRLSAIEDADEILVLNHGEISERGTHTSLTQQDGWYSRMWTYQQMEAALDER